MNRGILVSQLVEKKCCLQITVKGENWYETRWPDIQKDRQSRNGG